jgi:hypothetical protein
MIWIHKQGETIEERQKSVLETVETLNKKIQLLRDAEEQWFKSQSGSAQYQPFPLEFQLTNVYVTAAEQVANYLLSIVQK